MVHSWALTGAHLQRVARPQLQVIVADRRRVGGRPFADGLQRGALGLERRLEIEARFDETTPHQRILVSVDSVLEQRQGGPALVLELNRAEDVVQEHRDVLFVDSGQVAVVAVGDLEELEHLEEISVSLQREPGTRSTRREALVLVILGEDVGMVVELVSRRHLVLVVRARAVPACDRRDEHDKAVTAWSVKRQALGFLPFHLRRYAVAQRRHAGPGGPRR